MQVDQGREAGKGGWVERGRVRAGDRGMEGDREGGVERGRVRAGDRGMEGDREGRGWKVEGAGRG